MTAAPPVVNTAPDPKISIVSVSCRICYDSDKDEELITPCRCKGTVAFVHRSCLETWLGESNTTTCELCHQEFKTERFPRYTSSESIWRWCFTNTAGANGVRSDILACTIITPLAIIITYVCLFSSEYYNQQKFSNMPAARWTSVSLLVMIAIMLLGYYMWVYSVIRMHARLWYNWWQRTCDVRYIPPSTINITSAVQSGYVNVHPNTSVTNINLGNEHDVALAEPATINVEYIPLKPLSIITTAELNMSVIDLNEDENVSGITPSAVIAADKENVMVPSEAEIHNVQYVSPSIRLNLQESELVEGNEKKNNKTETMQQNKPDHVIDIEDDVAECTSSESMHS